MGYWRFNPSEPCCNPPAGKCQCQPCRWKVVEYSGFEPFPGFFDEAIVGGVEQSMGGWTSDRQLITNRTKLGVTTGNTHGPPWFRLWQAQVPYNPGFHSASHSHWAFGYWEWHWSFGSFTGGVNIEQTWGLGIHTISDGFLSRIHNSAIIEMPFMWWWFDGFNLPGWEHRWNCWGPNKLIYSQLFVGLSHVIDPDLYVIVEPDV